MAQFSWMSLRKSLSSFFTKASLKMHHAPRTLTMHHAPMIDQSLWAMLLGLAFTFLVKIYKIIIKSSGNDCKGQCAILHWVFLLKGVPCPMCTLTYLPGMNTISSAMVRATPTFISHGLIAAGFVTISDYNVVVAWLSLSVAPDGEQSMRRNVALSSSR